MNALRIGAVKALSAARPTATRSFVSSVPRLAAKPAEKGGHDDHAHHPHLVFEKGPFTKRQAFMSSFGILISGVVVIMGAFYHQQIKQGYIK